MDTTLQVQLHTLNKLPLEEGLGSIWYTLAPEAGKASIFSLCLQLMKLWAERLSDLTQPGTTGDMIYTQTFETIPRQPWVRTIYKLK